jgi:hypothetical protein
LIVAHETPYDLLCRVFRYCIFTCTRDEIRRHLDMLLNASIEMDRRYGLAYIDSGMEISLSGISSTFTSPDISETVEIKTSEAYVGPEGINEYLYNKGLVIDLESSLTEFSLSSNSSEGSKATGLNELCGKEKVKLSVNKLFRGEITPGPKIYRDVS